MCAIFAVWSAPERLALRLGLHAQQHRAIDYAGIVSSERALTLSGSRAGTCRGRYSPNNG